MKKFCLVAAGIFLSIFAATAQDVDSAAYKSKKLTLEEADLISSYYSQTGDHASVTGGIGTQKLTDISNIIDVKLYKYNKKGNKHHFGLEMGIDHYTSASSDQIDLKANSSASHGDTRFYPSLSWSVDNEKHNYSVGANISFSQEFDYQSRGFGLDFSKQSKNKNTEVSFKAKAYLDQVKLVYPVELRSNSGGRGGDDYATTSRNSYSGSLSVSHVLNQRFQFMLIAELIKQTGFLSLPFHRVYFTNGSVHTEQLPSSRLKIPLGARASYFLGDKMVLRGFYRYYHDDWGLNANLAELEVSYKVSPFFSVVPFYRFYQQSGADYFKPYATHTASDAYYTSNYDLSNFTSHFFGGGLRFSTPGGILGIQRFNMLELRYGFYKRSDGLQSSIVSMNLKFK